MELQQLPTSNNALFHVYRKMAKNCDWPMNMTLSLVTSGPDSCVVMTDNRPILYGEYVAQGLQFLAICDKILI